MTPLASLNGETLAEGSPRSSRSWCQSHPRHRGRPLCWLLASGLVVLVGAGLCVAGVLGAAMVVGFGANPGDDRAPAGVIPPAMVVAEGSGEGERMARLSSGARESGPKLPILTDAEKANITQLRAAYDKIEAVARDLMANNEGLQALVLDLQGSAEEQSLQYAELLGEHKRLKGAFTRLAVVAETQTKSSR